MTMTRLLAGAAAIAALASCATAPAPEPFGGAFATIEFLDGDYISGSPIRMTPTLASTAMHHGDDRDYGARRTVEFFSATGASACTPAARIVKFKSRTRDEQTQTTQFKAGMPIGIVAHTQGESGIAGTAYGGGAVAPDTINCRSVAVFTPQTGRTYIVVQNEFRGGRCELDVRDKDTNAAPPNLVIREEVSCPSA